jgi:hypothetical protein
MIPSPVVRYQVDAHDCLSQFGEGWTEFAEANSGQAFLPSLIQGRVLWEFISEPTTIHLYRQMLLRVRRGAPRISFTFRCDSPDRRRLLSMDITAAESGAVQFSAQPVSEEERPHIALLEATGERGDELVTMCAWCQRVKLDAEAWVEIEDAMARLDMFNTESIPRLTHGMCAPCMAAMFELAEK